MLVLSRKIGESITIDDDIKITLLEIRGNKVKIGVEAPKSRMIHREEIYYLIQQENKDAIADDKINRPQLKKLWDDFIKIEK